LRKSCFRKCLFSFVIFFSYSKHTHINQKWGNKRGNKFRHPNSVPPLLRHIPAETKKGFAMSLSDMQCRTAKPKAKKYKLFDGEGLYLEVMPSGARYWRLKYRSAGKEKRVAIGVYPNVSLSDARKAKNEAKDKLKDGIDPMLAKLEEKQTALIASTTTFRSIAIEWHKKNAPAWDKRYAQTVMHRLEKYAFPFLGSFPLINIKPLLVLGCIQSIEKTAPEMARRVKQLCSHIFRYAIVTNRMETDPTYGLEAALMKFKRGHYASISVDDMPKLLIDIHNYQGRLNRQTYLAIRLMLLTFVRTKELIGAQWSEINFEKAMWVIPAERMKMRLPHIVPLSKQALAILSELKDKNLKSEFVFPSIPRPNKSMSNGTILVALGRMGYKNKMTGHGFRSLALGILKEKLGYSHEIADRQLAHVRKSSTDRAYDRSQFLSHRTEMMQKYASYLDKIFMEELANNIA